MCPVYARAHTHTHTHTHKHTADVKPAGGGAPGIYFFTLDCSRLLPALGASFIFNLPYRLAGIQRGRPRDPSSNNTAAWSFSSVRYGSTQVGLNVSWVTSGAPETEGEVASEAAFFVERYCLYNLGGVFLRTVALPRGAPLWRGSITHAPWPVQRAEVLSIEHSLVRGLGGLKITGQVLAHFSPGVKDVTFFWEAVESSGAHCVQA